MKTSIDDILDNVFTTEHIIKTFYEYKYTKWDRLSGLGTPIVDIPIGTDGVTYQAFEKQLERNARNIVDRIHSGTYIFHPFREVDIKKDSNQPYSVENTRTLGVASIRDALVQRILYKDVLYKPVDAVFSQLDQRRPVSYAYRKGKSAPLAAQQIFRYIHDGYWYTYDADLSKYFDNIDHDILLHKLAQVIDGDSSRTYQLLRRFVRVDRTQHSSYRQAKRRGEQVGYRIFHWKKPVRFIPKSNSGIPQGGILSGMLANLYLHEFDDWIINGLGNEVDLQYIRYADDFVVLVQDSELLDTVDQQVRKKFTSDTLLLKLNDDKTRKIDIRVDGLSFVGFNFDKTHMRVRQASILKFKNRIIHEIFHNVPDIVKQENTPDATLYWLIKRINQKTRGLRGPQVCPRCQYVRVGSPRSWIAVFQCITDIEQLRDLDKWIRQQLYSHIFNVHGIRIRRSDLKSTNPKNQLKTLVKEVHDVRKARRRPCLCDIEEQNHNIWAFSSDVFAGRSFVTLAQKLPFTVPYVGIEHLQVSIRGRQHNIEKNVIQDLWDRLVAGEKVSRLQLESEGVRCTSQLAALLADLPGINVGLHPILLSYDRRAPASFLMDRTSTL